MINQSRQSLLGTLVIHSEFITRKCRVTVVLTQAEAAIDRTDRDHSRVGELSADI